MLQRGSPAEVVRGIAIAIKEHCTSLVLGGVTQLLKQHCGKICENLPFLYVSAVLSQRRRVQNPSYECASVIAGLGALKYAALHGLSEASRQLVSELRAECESAFNRSKKPVFEAFWLYCEQEAESACRGL